MPRTTAVSVRQAEEGDLAAVHAIYDEAVLNSTVTFDTVPRSLQEQRRWLRDHGHPYCVLVALRGEEVVGWAALSVFRPKPAYQFTAEDSVYVARGARGQGVGGLLLTRLLEEAGANGLHSVVALIAGDNPASVRLHRRHGFRRVGVEREVGYKLDRWLDVTIMQRLLR